MNLHKSLLFHFFKTVVEIRPLTQQTEKESLLIFKVNLQMKSIWQFLQNFCDGPKIEAFNKLIKQWLLWVDRDDSPMYHFLPMIKVLGPGFLVSCAISVLHLGYHFYGFGSQVLGPDLQMGPKSWVSGLRSHLNSWVSSPTFGICLFYTPFTKFLKEKTKKVLMVL